MKQYLDLVQAVRHDRSTRSSRTGNSQYIRLADAIRPDQRISASDYQKINTRAVIEGASVVPAWRDQRKVPGGKGVDIWDEWADERAILVPSTASSGVNGGHLILTWAGTHPPRWQKSLKESGSVHSAGAMWSPPGTWEKLRTWHWNDVTSCDQFYVANGKLSCQLYQRSADIFLGVPFNIASYAFLTHMVAHVTGLEVHEFIHTLGDRSHLVMPITLTRCEFSLERTPRALPVLKEFNPEIKDIDSFKYEDFVIEGYDPHPAIKGNISI